jgi:hypothetical protein
MGIYRVGPQIVALSLVTGTLSPQSPAERTKLTVQVLDSKSGKPVIASHILLFAGATSEAHERSVEATTDSNGLAVVVLDLDKNKFAQLWVDWHSLCEHNPNSESFGLNQTHARGVALNHCSRLTSEVKPNQLTVYVRPETFWGKMGH